jgi:hypothetical protein
MGVAKKPPARAEDPRAIRPELPEVPRMMRQLPIDKRGYPVPWFVNWVNGEPEFRAMDGKKLVRAINENLCWVCGNRLWREKVFVIGPMCAVNRISSEPPSHRECAQFSATACPFLSRPHMVRREDGLSEAIKNGGAGLAVKRNPGVTLLWFAYRFEVRQIAAVPQLGVNAGILFHLGRPFKTEWYAEGRPATRAEILASIDSGLSIVYEANRKQGGDVEAGEQQIRQQLAQAMKLVPRNAPGRATRDR